MVGTADGPGRANGDRSPLPPRRPPEPGFEAPPPATGIDYLRLVEARADAQLDQRISYAGMPDAEAQRRLSGGDGAVIGDGDDEHEVVR